MTNFSFRLIIGLFVCISSFIFAQDNQKSLQKDPYFTPKTAPQKNAPPPEKVKHIHSDELRKDEKYDGNNYFTGNVQFSHQGSLLNADLVIVYEEQNFIKAIGNVKLQNADGSVITADEMEYDGNTQRGIAKKNVVLTDPKGTVIKTETMYYDRVSNQAY
ncbi:MAG: OstA-like protein, partial [Chryseobacterium taeanense]